MRLHALHLALVLCCLILSSGENCDKNSGRASELSLQAVPYAPPNLAIKVAWNPSKTSQCVDYYMVRASLASAASGSPPYLTWTGRDSKAKLEGLQPKTSYRVVVIPVSKKFGLLPSVSGTITTPGAQKCDSGLQPGKPIKLKATGVAGKPGTAKVWYSAPYPYVSCISGFSIEGFDASTGEKVFSKVEPSEVRKTTVTGLKPSHTYTLKVAATWSKGTGEDEWLQYTTPAAPAPAAAAAAQQDAGNAANYNAAPAAAQAGSAGTTSPAPAQSGCGANTAPAAPADLTATPDGADKIRLAWIQPDSTQCITGYHLDAYELKTGDRVMEVQTKYTIYTLSGLKQGVEYVFTVAAVNEAGDSVPETAYCSI